MDSSGDEETLVALCAYAYVVGQRKKRKTRKRKSVWVRGWISRRGESGAYNALLKELEAEDPRSLKNFLRMDMANFNFLLDKVRPIVERRCTPMRDSIPAGEKLALTLRYIASGDSYQSLEFLYRIPKNTICQFVPEVCAAISSVLHKDYVQCNVGKMHLQHAIVVALIAVALALHNTGVIRKRQTTGRCLKRDETETGVCVCCEDKYRGPTCEDFCETCITVNKHCIYMCEGGFYGPTCANKCPETCKAGNNGKPICKESDNSFDCSNGCKEGRYGPQCNNTCSSKCKDNVCFKIDGRCVGCKYGLFGQNCNLKCTSCTGGCFQNGTCKGGCRQGYQGPKCSTTCLTCDECYETCSRQCQDNCPKTVLEICLLNGTCVYNCSGVHAYHDICHNSTNIPEMVEKPEKKEKAEASPTVMVVILPVLLVLLVVIAVPATIFVCYRRRRKSRRQNNFSPDEDGPMEEEREHLVDNPECSVSKSTPHQEEIEISDMPATDNEINPTIDVAAVTSRGERSLTKMLDDLKPNTIKGDKEDIEVTNIPKFELEINPTISVAAVTSRGESSPTKMLDDPKPNTIKRDKGIEFTGMPVIDDEFKPTIAVVTESLHGKNSITEMLDDPKHYTIKGSFTVGKIENASQKIVSIHLSRKLNGLEPMNLITRCLGRFEHIKHVIIVGVCSVSEGKRGDIQLGDVIASVSNDRQPYIYIQQSDNKTWTPKKDTLQEIVKKLGSDGNTPWTEDNERCPDNIYEVPNLHCGIFGSLDALHEDDESITAFDSGIGEVLDSITGNGIESFLLVRGVCDCGNETAEANVAAATVVRTVIERIDDGDS